MKMILTVLLALLCLVPGVRAQSADDNKVLAAERDHDAPTTLKAMAPIPVAHGTTGS